MMSYFRLATGGQAASGHGKLQSRLKQYGPLSTDKREEREDATTGWSVQSSGSGVRT